MTKGRIEAFSDGVLAIIITIMVLEFDVPDEPSWKALEHHLPSFLSYVLSFVFIGIYWGNHHHLMHTVKRVTAGIIWSNLNLLFWLSLIPFATGWMGNTHFARNSVTTYAILMMLCDLAYFFLQKTIQSGHKGEENMAKAYAAHERKGMVSIALYALSIAAAQFNTLVSGCIFLVVAILWIVPDKGIEKSVAQQDKPA